MYEEQNNLSVEKYLKAIAVMTNSVGKLDVLKCSLKAKNDLMSVAILENVIKDLSKAVGMEYHPIDVQIPEVKTPAFNTTYPTNPEPVVVNIVTDEKATVDNIKTEQNSNIDFAKYMQEAEKTIKTVFSNNNKKVVKNNAVKINQSKGFEIDTTGKMTYKFVNSSTLDFMVYDKTKREMLMTFLRNGRTYLYKNIPMFIVDNLAQLDERGTSSVGSYFQQNVVKQPRKYPYQELTDEQYIG